MPCERHLLLISWVWNRVESESNSSAFFKQTILFFLEFVWFELKRISLHHRMESIVIDNSMHNCNRSYNIMAGYVRHFQPFIYFIKSTTKTFNFIYTVCVRFECIASPQTCHVIIVEMALAVLINCSVVNKILCAFHGVADKINNAMKSCSWKVRWAIDRTLMWKIATQTFSWNV